MSVRRGRAEECEGETVETSINSDSDATSTLKGSFPHSFSECIFKQIEREREREEEYKHIILTLNSCSLYPLSYFHSHFRYLAPSLSLSGWRIINIIVVVVVVAVIYLCFYFHSYLLIIAFSLSLTLFLFKDLVL